MTRGLALMAAGGGALSLAGLALLARPAAVRRLFAIPQSEGAAYALRMIGAMLFAAGLFTAGAAAALSLHS